MTDATRRSFLVASVGTAAGLLLPPSFAASQDLTGLSVKEVGLPAAVNLRTIMGPEAYVYHSQWIMESPEKYQPQTRERLIQFASAVTAQDYVQARRQCDLLRTQIKKVFTTVDLLVMPTM